MARSASHFYFYSNNAFWLRSSADATHELEELTSIHRPRRRGRNGIASAFRQANSRRRRSYAHNDPVIRHFTLPAITDRGRVRDLLGGQQCEGR